MGSSSLPALPRRSLFRWLAGAVGALGLGAALPRSHAAEPATNAATASPWYAFCDQLKLAGDQILRPEAPQDEFNRAEGYRYLSRLLRAALEQEVECSNPQFPVFYQLCNETIKFGADNPDNDYLNAQLDGRYDYRIRGTRGTVSYIGFNTRAGGYGKSGTLLPTGAIDTETLKIEADGTFEVIVSATRKPGNWLPMTADSTALLAVRQTFLDRSREQRAELTIECLNGAAHPAPLDPRQLNGQLLAAANFVQSTARIFADWSQRFTANPNAFTVMNQSETQRQGGDPSFFYAQGYWRLQPDEALVIDISPTQAKFWNLQVDNYWMESLDYRYFTIHVNKQTTRYRPDGGATLVLAHRDPGVPNWLNTTGHELGTLLYRVVHGVKPSYPKTRVVKLAEVKGLVG
jgi:hypothetical protein